MRRILTSAAAVVFAAIALAACGGDDDGGGDEGAVENDSAGATTSIDLVATDFKFDKTEITATGGQQVKFVLTNDSDSTEHNLTIEDLAVDQDAAAGESAEQTVTPEAGTYEYFCEYHPQNMKGTLTVT